MPARSNEYQRLVYLINRALAQSEAQIIESAMLYDSEAQTDREIDILLKSKISGHEILIGIECTSVKNPVDLVRLEGLKEKHRKVGINKTVVVSRSGFTKTAKDYARKNHIQLLTFDAAQKTKWNEVFAPFKKLTIMGRTYKIKKVQIHAIQQSNEQPFILDDKVLVDWNGNLINLSKFCGEIWHSSEAGLRHGKELRDNEINGSGNPWVDIEFAFKEKIEFRDSNGTVVYPGAIRFLMHYSSNYHEINSKQVEYDGHEYVVGHYEGQKKERFASAFLREQAGKITGTLEVGGDWFSEVPTSE